MQHPYQERAPSKPRTLASIRSRYQDFLKDGAKKQRSKQVSFSVVHEPMMPIEINHVSFVHTTTLKSTVV